MRSVLFFLVLFAAADPTAAQDRGSFEEACASGQLGACSILGLMYETGAGVDQDLRRAADIYARTCDQGETSGCTSLGLLMAHGLGMPEDRQGAADLYRTACDADDDFGCDLLAALEWEGPITEPQHFLKRGRVGDAKSAVMLAGALVVVPRLGVRGLTDAEGRFSLERVEEGRYGLRAEALGYEPMTGTVIVPGYSEFVVLLQPLDWDHPDAPGNIDGRVTDERGQGIGDVEVSVLEHEGVRSLSDEEGRFSLRRVAAGLATLQFSRLGYATRETMLIVQPDATARIDAVMSVDAVDLDPIEVTVEDRSAYLQRNGFYRRQQRGFGRQLTQDDFVGAWTRVGDMLRELPGIRVTGPDIYGRQFAFSRRAVPNNCQLDVFFDGAMTRDGNVNLANPSDIEAVEVYRDMDVPAEYSRLGNCGVVLIWTVRP